MEVAEPDPERQREHDRDPDRDRRQLEVLERLRRDEAAVVPEKPERIRERVQIEAFGDDHAAAALRHGVSCRWTITSAPSATSARAIASSPATTYSVR